MKKILFVLLFLMLSSLCFAHEFTKVEAFDEFGDSTGDFYYTLESDKKGTFKSYDTLNSPLSWNIYIDKDGISRIVLKEKAGYISDLSTSSRSGYVDTSTEYTIKFKYADGSISTLYGELIRGDEYMYDSLRFYLYDDSWRNYFDSSIKKEFAKAGNIGNGEIKISITSDYGSYSLGSLDVSGCESLFFDNTLYNEALALVEKGEYENAIGKLNELESKDSESYSYYDCEEKIEEINNLIREEKIAPLKEKLWKGDFQVGDIVCFGQFEGKSIEWIVLEKIDSKALLLSKDILCEKETTIETWENCSLRAWLNEDFYSNSFTQKERNIIQLSKLDNSSFNGGNDTEDYIFVLSIYDYVNPKYNLDSSDLSWPREIVYYYNSARDAAMMGQYVGVYNGVRPAIWINL